jgi:hypothetical protein
MRILGLLSNKERPPDDVLVPDGRTGLVVNGGAHARRSRPEARRLPDRLCRYCHSPLTHEVGREGPHACKLCFDDIVAWKPLPNGFAELGLIVWGLPLFISALLVISAAICK